MASVRFGRRDALVSNAGIGPISRLDELRVADWEEMIDVNLKGFLYGIAAALPVSDKQGFGHFVNIASTAGLTISPTIAVYTGTKNAYGPAIAFAIEEPPGVDVNEIMVRPAAQG
jgi:NADP-dependent 3-hydroxy acid dehydrogenase YdfG